MTEYSTLRSELAELGEHISPESLTKVLLGDIKLTHAAYLEMESFIASARKMFHGECDET
jgi:hypothetical protein